MTENKIVWDIIDKEEPRGQSITLNGIPCTARTCVTRLNRLTEENEQLKQQLLYDGDSVCDICKHEYLTPSGDYFISNCRKGHEECSKEDLRYCTDFEVKELKE